MTEVRTWVLCYWHSRSWIMVSLLINLLCHFKKWQQTFVVIYSFWNIMWSKHLPAIIVTHGYSGSTFCHVIHISTQQAHADRWTFLFYHLICHSFTRSKSPVLLHVTYALLSSSLFISLPIRLLHHHMGLTAQENVNLKQGGAPNMTPENSFYYS